MSSATDAAAAKAAYPCVRLRLCGPPSGEGSASPHHAAPRLGTRCSHHPAPTLVAVPAMQVRARGNSNCFQHRGGHACSFSRPGDFYSPGLALSFLFSANEWITVLLYLSKNKCRQHSRHVKHFSLRELFFLPSPHAQMAHFPLFLPSPSAHGREMLTLFCLVAANKGGQG